MESLPPIDNPTAGDISTRSMMALHVYFCKAYGEERLRASLKRANLGPKMDLDYLRDENNWVSFSAGQRIIDVLDEDADEPDFIIKAGLATATRESAGFAYTVFKVFGDPKTCYAQLFKTLRLYNRVGEFNILELKRNFLRFNYHSSVIEPNNRFSVYRVYQFACFPLLWGLPPAKVKMLECQVTGETQTFEYELRWITPRSNGMIVLGALLGIATAYFGFTPLIEADSFLYSIGSGLIGGGLIGLVFEQRRMLRERGQMLKEQAVDIIHSINALQARYDEVQALNLSLEQKVEARTTELIAVNERLQELDKLKDRFLANISHELRTPLVALSSIIQMVLDRADLSPPQQRELLNSGQGALDDMLENVNDLLLKTRSAKAMLEMRWSRFDIGAFVRGVVAIFEASARQSQVRLRCEVCLSEPIYLYADRSKLKKILNNLLSNALKFTEQGEVLVTVEQNGARCRLSVTDSGPGIPADELDDIFEPFYQASNNPLREVRGTGIGLSLVKDLVEAHYGRIQVQSYLGQGSRFSVLLPLGMGHIDWRCFDDADIAEETDKRVQRGLRSFEELDLTPFRQVHPEHPRILLVEDNPQIVQVLGYVLRDHYNLQFARDGQEGLELARAERPDLIISDIMMPRQDGYSLIRAIRSDTELQQIPIILLTSKTGRAARLQGFEQGADEYLTKPFDNEEVLVRVRGLLEQRRLQAELVHVNKLMVAGQLAAGVAHEIGNPLSFAQSSVATIARLFQKIRAGDMPLDVGMEKIGAAIARVQDGTERVATITEALRGFIRPGAAGFQYCDLHAGLEATLKIIRANHKGGVRFDTRYELDQAVECNINQINQVVMNLLQNAVDALAGRADASISIHTFRENATAHIEIRDNGPGIPKHLMNRVFTPFFTTKQLGTGMGLGLHICRQIVSEHGGDLVLENQEGLGVLSKVLLPIHHKGASHESARYTHPGIDRRLEEAHYPHRR